MPDRLAEARERYETALIELGDQPPAPGGQWPDTAWVRAQWHLMRAQALEGLSRLEAREGIARIRQRVERYAEQAATTRDV